MSATSPTKVKSFWWWGTLLFCSYSASQSAPQPTAEVQASATTVAVERAGSFSTRHARFEPADFDDLPGWDEDPVAEAWQAFRQSCGALGKKPAWQGLCARASRLRPDSDAVIRQFFEAEFVLYRIMDPESPTGIVTGYYEPLLRGSRKFGRPYVYPVYTTPNDLLLVHAKLIKGARDGRLVYARVVGREVIPIPSDEVPDAQTYRLDLGGITPDIRDKRYRVRVEGNRIVPYYSRAEIEQGALRSASVIVWVDNPFSLYSMQVQGSGKVRLAEGGVVRLAYAEQNGHPFLPRGRTSNELGRREQLGAKIRTRGAIMAPARSGASDEPLFEDVLGIAGAESGSAEEAEPTRGISRQGAASPKGQDLDPDEQAKVDAVIRLLLGDVAEKPATQPQLKDRKNTAVKRQPPARVAEPTDNSFESKAFQRANELDPSYVFFREIADSASGPIGALGVPLTAGRSIAVDPRTTPLGFPVFLSTSDSVSSRSRINGLMMAQDTGGAIRGAVRADYFWGFGAKAGALAMHTKEAGRMWLLFPKGQQVAAREAVAGVRGIGVVPGADCVVPDPDICVEE